MAVSNKTFAQRLDQLAHETQHNRPAAPAIVIRAGRWLNSAAQVGVVVFALCFAIKLTAVLMLGTKTYDKRAEAGIIEMGSFGPYAAPLLRPDPVTGAIAGGVAALGVQL